MKEGVSAMARLFLFIPFPVETWRAASLCIKYFINQCMCVLRNINHSFIYFRYILSINAYVRYHIKHSHI